MESPSAPPATAEPEIILCRVTRWYYRRMIFLAAMLLAMGLYFVYDGKIGYPKDNAIAAKKDWFDNEVLKSFDAARAGGRLDAWVADARAKGWPTGSDSQAPRWVSWAAEHNFPEDPHRWSDAEITQQYWLGGAAILAALIVGGLILLNRRKTVRGGPDHWITPEGKTVRFADVFRLDLRKWPHKGIGYAWYRETADGPERRAILDDLKFTNMQLVLDRLRSQFKGELIEKIDDPQDEETDPAGKPES
ncbi:MAG: hypothetical protein U0984_17960 [Prosthecobacter sp.]|nr:hypothetical protein [Prosthecobacter sp.]